MSRRLVAALACRAGGRRLYGKPLQHLDLERNVTVLEYMIELIATESLIAETVLGVSVGPENEAFHAIAARRGLRSIRGDEIDVVSRLIGCGEIAGATDIFRVTTESPFTYFEGIAGAWDAHLAKDADVTSIMGLPEGAGFEIIRLDALRRSHAQGEARHRSELCTLYIREHRDQFTVQVVEAEPPVQRMDLRLTIDYPEDLVVCRRVFEALRAFAPRIPMTAIVEFLDAHPETTALVKPYVVGQRWFA